MSIDAHMFAMFARSGTRRSCIAKRLLTPAWTAITFDADAPSNTIVTSRSG